MRLDLNLAAQLMFDLCLFQLSLVQDLMLSSKQTKYALILTAAHLESNNELALLLSGQVHVAKLAFAQTASNIEVCQLEKKETLIKFSTHSTTQLLPLYLPPALALALRCVAAGDRGRTQCVRLGRCCICGTGCEGRTLDSHSRGRLHNFY